MLQLTEAITSHDSCWARGSRFKLGQIESGISRSDDSSKNDTVRDRSRNRGVDGDDEKEDDRWREVNKGEEIWRTPVRNASQLSL